ncbi:putative toxin-antitoxin system toxin component, PIN family [Spirosoma panaciterrae]|uniref:putative toxin-antitoxin system toxin component, PIN family n=1 Tax=Spirosoma panaciterrae TaxID=496058 RepID=UPI00035DC8D7|nr:putative toxin-antitoxin system toxin component, PIN family [Spirosoma panaciterrae]
MNTTVLPIVLDTNILVAIIGRKSPFRWLFDSIVTGKIALCVTTEILLEYREIMEQKNGEEVAENVVNFITVMPTTNHVQIFYDFNLIVDDADDNKFVNCAISANATYLVSNDGHYQILHQIGFPKVNWLTLADFESRYKALLLTE